MLTVLTAVVARLAVRALGFWSVPPLSLSDEHRAQLESEVGREVDAGSGALLVPPSGVSTLELLRWMSETRPVLFHGTNRDDVELLSPVRKSRDSSEFGDQRAVFATSDAVWATFFAVTDRTNPRLHTLRNGTITVVGGGGGRLFGPRYYFAVNREAVGPHLWREGVVYVVDRESFVADQRDFGVIDNGQWASVEPVRWLARVRVTPEDFPFRDRTFGIRAGEPELRTYLRLRTAGSRAAR